MALQMAQNGWHLRSGFADGADKAFGLGAAQHSDATGDHNCWTMYLPWDGFNGAPKNDPNFVTVTAHDEIYAIAKEYHPNWANLSDGIKMLMIRNVAIVLGPDLASPAAFLAGWTAEAQRGGGTGHAMRVAAAYKIPIFDLASEYDQRAVVEFIDGCEKSNN